MSAPQAITRASVTIGWAAHAAGFSPRALRLALGTGGKFPLLGKVDRAAIGHWRRFSPIDIPRLAVLSRLVNHGVPVSSAGHIVSTTIDKHLVGLLLCGIDVPRLLILSQFADASLHVALSEDGRYIASIKRAGTPPIHETTLILDIEAIAATALSRLPTPQPFTPIKELAQ